MTATEARAEPRDGTRDLFWLRICASAIDIALGVVVASLAAVLLYAASDGKLRSSTLVKTIGCQPVRSISAKVFQGVPAPPGSRPVAGKLCVISMAGLETARYLTIELQGQEGEVTRSLAFSRPVDRKGNPVAPMILDWVYPLAFILIMTLGEGLSGATPGKRLLGLRVTSANGGRLALPRALLRNAIKYGGAALVLIAPLVVAVTGLRLPQLAYYISVGVFGLLVLAPIAMLAEAGPRALYDRWAGAEVVRT